LLLAESFRDEEICRHQVIFMELVWSRTLCLWKSRSSLKDPILLGGEIENHDIIFAIDFALIVTFQAAELWEMKPSASNGEECGDGQIKN
jgi:hypothetical protein